jgi:hypothetical protein
MKPLKKMLAGGVWLLGGGAVLIAISALALSSLFGRMCANDVIKEVVSPDGKKKVVVFQRNCGATTDFSTQASVLSVSGSLPNDGGNVFSADTNHGAAPSGPGGGPELEASWVGPKELVFAHHPQARVFKAEASIGDTHVRFVSR